MKGSRLRTFAVINQKGGCGKTTTSINLAAAFADLGRKTLLVDMDPQGHCGLGLAVPEAQLKCSIADALVSRNIEKFDLQDILWQISAKLDLAPATTSLAAAEHTLAHQSDRDLRLAKLLRNVAETYDICIIDCPPSIGLLTFNAMRAAGEVIIPVETGYFALSGAMKQATTLQVLADRVGHAVCFHVLPTMYDMRTKMAAEIVAELHKHFGSAVLDIPIQYNAKIKEAASFGQAISEYDPASRGSQDFERLARHLLSTQPTPKRIKVGEDAARRSAIAGEAAPEALDSPRQFIGIEPVTLPSRVRLSDHATHAAAANESAQPAMVGSGPFNDDAAPSHSHNHSETREHAHASAAPSSLNPEPRTLNPSTPKPGVSRVAELVARAKALTERTAQLQRRLAADPDIARVEAEDVVQAPPAADPQVRRSLDEKLRMFYGARSTDAGLLFVQPADNARSVCIAGDFNDWSDVATPLALDRRLGVWQTCLPLPTGRYRYRLVVDGKWCCDPHNPRLETNPFGEQNNLAEVK